MVAIAKPFGRELSGRICWACVGSTEAGDDAAGIRLGELLEAGGLPEVKRVGTDPERFVLSELVGRYEHIVFVDAVDFGAEPGDVALLDASEMAIRFPQVSTHRLSLGLLASWIEASGRTSAWLLAIQPASLRPAAGLTPHVKEAVESVAAILTAAYREGVSRP